MINKQQLIAHPSTEKGNKFSYTKYIFIHNIIKFMVLSHCWGLSRIRLIVVGLHPKLISLTLLFIDRSRPSVISRHDHLVQCM